MVGFEPYVLRSPLEEAQLSPALFVAEVLTHLSFLLALVHACRHEGGQHLMMVLVPTIAASFVDPFFLISERSYFHDRACILLADRRVAPWQFDLFGCIACLAASRVWTLNLAIVPETCLTALMGGLTFYGFDMIACKFMIYQWHQHDPLYSARTSECVPSGSTYWTMGYAATASVLTRLTYLYARVEKGKSLKPNSREWWKLTLILSLMFLPLHVVPFFVWYAPLGMAFGMETFALVTFNILLVIIFAATLRNPRILKAIHEPANSPAVDAWLDLAHIVWFGGIAFVAYALNPEDISNHSRHQPWGGTGSAICAKREYAAFGLYDRKKFMCADDLQHWTVEGDPPLGAEFYTTTGKPKTNTWHLIFTAWLVLAATAHFVVRRMATSTSKHKPA
jgi:hypothetical protein